MAWVGLERYGYLEDAQRLAYRFLYMMTTAFVDFNGVVPEKVCTIFELLVVVVEPEMTSGAMILCVRVVRRSEAVSSCGRRVRKPRCRLQNGPPRRVWLDERCGFVFPLTSYLIAHFRGLSAAYQVGLSFLTSHMRRAVAACTSPEVFFGRTMMGEHTAAPPSSVVNDPLGLAMENLTVSSTGPVATGTSPMPGSPKIYPTFGTSPSY